MLTALMEQLLTHILFIGYKFVMLVSMTLHSFSGLMALKKLSQDILRWFLIFLPSEPQALYSLESEVKAIMRLNHLDKLFLAHQEPFKVPNFSKSPLRL